MHKTNSSLHPLAFHSRSLEKHTASSQDWSWILAAARRRITKHKTSCSQGQGVELCLRVWRQLLSCLAFTMPTSPLSCSTPYTGNPGSAFIHEDHPCSLPDVCLGGNLSLGGFCEGYLPVCQQINGLIQRAFKPAERLLISIGSGSSGQQGTVAFIIRLWAKNRVEHMTQFSPQALFRHPPASTGHRFVATGRCLPPGPVDTGQSSRKPSKSWG